MRQRSLLSFSTVPRWSRTRRPVLFKTADEDDDYLIALAEAHGVDAVVSGDGHLLEVTSSDLPVLTPRELADRLGLASFN